jgi:hypothetical protein
MTNRVATIADMWWDPEDGLSRLRIVPSPAPAGTAPLWLKVAIGTSTLFVRFELLAVIRGKPVYEAREWWPEDASGPPSPAPSFRPAGPSPGVPA